MKKNVLRDIKKREILQGHIIQMIADTVIRPSKLPPSTQANRIYASETITSFRKLTLNFQSTTTEINRNKTRLSSQSGHHNTPNDPLFNKIRTPPSNRPQ